MADPLSVAGLVTGAISLCLQLTGGLIDYLDAVKGRTEDLSSAKHKATQTSSLLLAIRDLYPRLRTSWPASATLVDQHVKSCESELSALHAYLSELSQPASSGSGLRLKLHEKKKMLTYPFNRSHITRLEERLTSVNSTLQIALQVADLDISTTSENRLDQIYDLVLSMSQVQVARTQSSSFTTTLRSPERMAASTGSMVQLGSIENAMTLASKPSLLSNSIKASDWLNSNQTRHNYLSQICPCQYARKNSYQRNTWGNFIFSYRTSSKRHLPSCEFSSYEDGTWTTHYTVAYTGLRRLFQKAFDISLVSTLGAGGRSISPIFTYYPTVDNKTAPAFRILTLAIKMVYDYDSGSMDASGVMKALELCFQSVFILYNQRRASPKDLDMDGRSLMHSATSIFSEYKGPWCETSRRNQFQFSIVRKLIGCGVPITVVDRFGETPFIQAATRIEIKRMNAVELVKLLLLTDQNMCIQPDMKIHSLSYFKAMLHDLELAEASGCGPLSLATWAGDDGRVQDLIERYPECVLEENADGMAALFFAIKHPPCLRLILEAGGTSFLKTCKDYQWPPLYCAISSGYRTSLQLLLDAGCPIDLYSSHGSNDPCIDDLILSTLRQRRDELKELALNNLTGAEAKFFGLYENKVLDGHALGVLGLIRSRGVTIPSYLQAKSFTPVYMHRNMKEDWLNKMWDLGFRDVDHCDSSGNIPLMSMSLFDRNLRWLIEHGADYWTPFSERSDSTIIKAPVTPAHFIIFWLGCKYPFSIREGDETCGDTDKQWLVEKLLHVRACDMCSCLCSQGGCTILKAFFDGWRRNCNWYYSAPEQLAKSWIQFFGVFQNKLSENDLMIVLRRLTFEALQITHTCCNFNHYFLSEYSDSLRTIEEVDEINSEQRFLLATFADLLEELIQIAHDDRGGTHLIVYDPEEFWIHRWLPLITKTLEELEGNNLTAEERSAGEAIGVVWGPPPPPTAPAPSGWPPTPEEVMEAVEKIMNE